MFCNAPQSGHDCMISSDNFFWLIGGLSGIHFVVCQGFMWWFVSNTVCDMPGIQLLVYQRYSSLHTDTTISAPVFQITQRIAQNDEQTDENPHLCVNTRIT